MCEGSQWNNVAICIQLPCFALHQPPPTSVLTTSPIFSPPQPPYAALQTLSVLPLTPLSCSIFFGQRFDRLLLYSNGTSTACRSNSLLQRERNTKHTGKPDTSNTACECSDILLVHTVFLAFLTLNKKRKTSQDKLKVYLHPGGTRWALQISTQVLFYFSVIQINQSLSHQIGKFILNFEVLYFPPIYTSTRLLFI